MRWQVVAGRSDPLKGERQRIDRTRHFPPYLSMQKQRRSELAAAPEVNPSARHNVPLKRERVTERAVNEVAGDVSNGGDGTPCLWSS